MRKWDGGGGKVGHVTNKENCCAVNLRVGHFGV